jgi:hypothetical protein
MRDTTSTGAGPGSSRGEGSLASWRSVVAVGATICAYLLTRLFALTSMPPFVDEALHIQ